MNEITYTVRIGKLNPKWFTYTVQRLKDMGARFDGEAKTWTITVVEGNIFHNRLSGMVDHGDIEII